MTQTSRSIIALFLLSSAMAGCASEQAVEANAEAVSAARGQALAQERCASCHAIGPEGLSPAPPAPVWREMAEANDLDQLGRRMSEGKLIHSSGTVSMPEFTFTPGEIGDLIAYMKTLRAG